MVLKKDVLLLYKIRLLFIGVLLFLTGHIWGCQKADEPDEKDVSSKPASTKSFDNSREQFDLAPLPKNDVAGTDANNDHIRDDIEEYINKNLSNKEWTRLAARQIARSLQHKLVLADNKVKVIDALQDYSDALECLSVSNENWDKVATEIEALSINTEERLNANFRSRRNGGGAFITGAPDKRKACNFDTSGLEP